MNPLRILFISRKHPPSIGGMQRLSYHLIQEMGQRVQARAVTWGGSQRLLPVFWGYAFMRSLWEGLKGIDLVSAGDPVVATIGSVMKTVFHVPTVTIVHGLDVTFRFGPYQWLVPRLLRSQDCVVCISDSARACCIARGVSPQRCVVIHPGVSVPKVLPARTLARKRLAELVGCDLERGQVLVTVGRLVPRKGVAWFLQSVYPQVAATNPAAHYVIVGSGPEEDRVRSCVSRLGLESRVSLTGAVSEDDLRHVYVASDLFVMPNVAVQGDMEGFGLVALESAAHGLPVLAADLEGIRDAVVPELTGRLVPAGCASAWDREISALLGSSDALRKISQLARDTVSDRFGWGRMADAYEALFRGLAAKAT